MLPSYTKTRASQLSLCMLASFTVMLMGTSNLRAEEPYWNPEAIQASLSREQPKSSVGGQPQISAALGRKLLIELANGGVCLLTRPEEALESECFQGAAASRLRDEVARQQREGFVTRLEDEYGRNTLHTVTPMQGLHALLGPGCPPQLCQSTPDYAALEQFPRLESGLKRFGDVLIQSDSKSLVMALSKDSALLLAPDAPPRLIHRDTLLDESKPGRTYRLLAMPEGRNAPATTVSDRQLKRLQDFLALCEDDLATCVRPGVSGVSGASPRPGSSVTAPVTAGSQPVLQGFSLPPRTSLGVMIRAGGVSSETDFASRATTALSLSVPGRFGGWDISPSFGLRFGLRSIPQQDVGRSLAGAGLELGVRAETYPLARHSYWWLVGVSAEANLDGLQWTSFSPQSQAVTLIVLSGLRRNSFALNAVAGMEVGRVVGQVTPMLMWRNYTGLNLGLELRALFGKETTR